MVIVAYWDWNGGLVRSRISRIRYAALKLIIIIPTE